MPYSSYLKFIKKIKLVEICSVDGAENLVIEERLYFPMYLLVLVSKNEDGWIRLNQFIARYTDQLFQTILLRIRSDALVMIDS